jgi:hypothetical protein
MVAGGIVFVAVGCVWVAVTVAVSDAVAVVVRVRVAKGV